VVSIVLLASDDFEARGRALDAQRAPRGGSWHDLAI
jgi:hypothetical protein